MSESTKQLRMTFDGDSVVRRRIREGEFSVFLEYSPPPSEQPFKLALLPGVELAKFASADPRITAIALTDGIASGPPQHDMAKVLYHLQESCKKEFIATVSGRGLTPAGMRERLAAYGSAQVRTAVAVTGFAAPSSLDGKGEQATDSYLDSTHLLTAARRDNPKLTLGATVNPFKYNVSDCYLQYYKMVKKIASGAEFFVTEAGWDMKKYQELQWFLSARTISVPVIARLLVVRPQELMRFVDQHPSGIVMSRELAAQMQRESAVNDVQAMTAQLRRLSLLAAGCRILGYSGIQIAGSVDTMVAQTLLDRIDEAFAECPSYEHWHRAWTDFHDRVEFAPYPNNYYMYRNLLEPDIASFHPDKAVANNAPLPNPTQPEWMRFQLAKNLGVGNGGLADLLRPLFGLQATEQGLHKTLYLSATKCPKGLQEGACGGSKPDGTCEFGHQPCMFHRCLALAKRNRSLEQFEEPCDAE